MRSLPATTSVPTARSARASAERRSSPSGTAGIGLDVGPGVRPHSGADLSTGTVDCGTLICPWHGLRSAGDWEFGWTTLPAHDDGVLAWVRLDTVGGEAPLDLPVVPVRPTGSGCTPSPGWSGSASPTTSSPTGSTLGTARGSTPNSFTHLDVLTAPPVDDDLAEDADRFLVAVTFRIGRLRIPVVAEFTSPEPRTIVVRIVDGEGTGSVVETHATPVDPGADRRPRTAVLEAVIAHSDRTGFVQARKAGARPGVLADAVLLPQLVPETSPRADPVSRPRRTRRGRPTPQSRSLRPSVQPRAAKEEASRKRTADHYPGTASPACSPTWPPSAPTMFSPPTTCQRSP